MASISNLSLIHQSRTSSFLKHHNRSHRNVNPTSNHLKFSPLHKKIEFLGKKSLETPTLNEILKLRRPSEFLLARAAAADAEGHELDLAKGFLQICANYCKCVFV